MVGMALSMSCRLAGAYSRDPLVIVPAVVSVVAMELFHMRRSPRMLVAGALAVVRPWPRP